MITANDFLSVCKNYGFNFFTGTPCSYLKPFINYVIDDPAYTYLDSTNEGDAVAIAAGSVVAGKKAVVMFQNSGLGNAVSPLTSLTCTFNIPVMVITTLRGEPGGPKDEPQHELMGQITIQMLETMKLKWEYFPREKAEVEAAVKRANDYMNTHRQPFVFVMRKGDVEEYALQAKTKEMQVETMIGHSDSFLKLASERSSRTETLRTLQSKTNAKNTVLVATTGMTGRELCELADLDNQLYMVGSMGCALAFSLGIAVNKPNANVVVLDGDGALLMRTGSMATAAYYAPANLTHILLDNEVHDSTGGQSTVTGLISFGAIAKGFGYKNVYSTDELNVLADVYSTAATTKNGPNFIHFKMKKGSPKDMGRPKVTPAEVAVRFTNFLAKL